ncbi:MAG: CotH kinase family protein [Fibrobacter sp.]|nr:CotH kinase family protein [Fibrobacter sp.]
MNSLALMGGLGLVFAGIMACSSEDTTSSKNNEELPPIRIDSTVTYDSSGNRIVTYDTIPAKVDSMIQVDPVTGRKDTIYDTVFIPADSSVRWVGNSSLVITEIAPVNLDWLDENGEDPGWVEIYNAGDEVASLKGYSLTNNLEKPRKWYFVDDSIQPKSFRVVFCDKGNLSKVESVDEGDLHKRPHTSWKLDKDGGSIYLIDRYYSIRDSVNYPAISSGLSYGILDGGIWKFFEKATPEKPNTESTAYDGMAPKFNFKSQGGFYSQALTLKPPTNVPEGASVRCTKNGSIPTKDSEKFDSDLKIESNMVLRCAVFKDGLLTKEVVTNTYFIEEDEIKMPVVAVSVDPVFFEKHYVKKSACGDSDPNSCPPGLMEDVEYPVHVEYFADGSSSKEKAFEIDAGISLMGGWSRVNDKKSVAIAMHEEYQAGKIKYPLFETRKGVNDEYKAFNLRNNGNRFVSDYVEDAMGGALLEGSGVDYQRSRQVVVFYNGKYYGIHDMRERYNRAYVETNYGINSNSVKMIKHLGAIDKVTASGDDAQAVKDYQDMLNFVGTNDMSVAENYAAAKTLLDVGNFADYMAAEIYYHNGDWPNNNVRAWSAPGQPWKFMVYDLDHGFGWKWGVTDPNGDKFNDGTNMFTWIKQGGGNKPCKDVGCFANLYIKLMANDEFKRMFINRSCVMLNSYLNSSRVSTIVDQMVATIPESEKKRDVEKFHQDEMYYPDGFDWKGTHLKSWASERDSKVLSEYKSEFKLGETVNVTIAATGNGSVLMEGMNLPSATYKGKFFSGMQMVLTAVPNAGSILDGWSGCTPIEGAADMCVATIDGDMTISATFK